MSRRVIRGLAFDELGAVVIDFVDGDVDLLENGVLLNHTVQIPPTDEFTDVVTALEKAAHRVLDAALASVKTAQPVVIADPDDDDSPSPYDNPMDGGQA